MSGPLEENSIYEPSYTKKRQLLSFFYKRNNRVLRNYSDINEFDFVETIKKTESYYRKQGKIAGLIAFLATWDSVLKNFLPISKMIFGVILSASLSEYFLYRNIDSLYNPLDEIFTTKYRPILESAEEGN